MNDEMISEFGIEEEPVRNPGSSTGIEGKAIRSVAEFLDEFLIIGPFTGIRHPRVDLGPFWESLWKITQVMLKSKNTLEGRWVLRSRSEIPPDNEETELRLRMLTKQMVKQAEECGSTVATLPGKEARFLAVVLSFGRGVSESPDLLWKAPRTEISALSMIAKASITPTNEKETHEPNI